MRLHPRSPFFGLYSSRFYIEKLKGTMTTCIIVIVPMWQGQKDLKRIGKVILFYLFLCNITQSIMKFFFSQARLIPLRR